MPWILPAARKKPSTLGLVDGQLQPCPSTPNCASSQSVIESQYIKPISYNGSSKDAHDKLIAILEIDPKASIEKNLEDYIHVKYRAFIFIDDVEFFFPEDTAIIHVRSASRVGHSDMGANKRRLKAISAAFSSRQ